MQRSLLLSISMLTAAASMSAGCDDLGSCEDPNEGRTLVRLNGTLMYAGQAIVVKSCATGCHLSSATGAARQGAPAGLDFDVFPVDPGDALQGDGGVVGVSVGADAVSALRARQRTVFDEREGIWEQVDDGLMPPGKIGEAFLDLASIVGIKFESDGNCTAGESLGTLGDAKGELKKWLACGSPLVETTSADLPYVAPPSDAPVAYQSNGVFPYHGAVGDQYPACGAGGGGGDGGAGGVTFQDVFDTVLSSCTTCHKPTGIWPTWDVETPEKAYTALLGADGSGAPSNCPSNSHPMVTASDPTASYIIAKVGGEGAGSLCNGVMPSGTTGVNAAQLQVLTDWIAAGAPGPGEGAGSGGGDAGPTADGDAGAADAGT